MRTIQSRRNSPLRARRSRYAYCPECMTCSLALRMLRLREPRYPEAASRTLRRRFWLWTDRLTLAIVAPDRSRGGVRRAELTRSVGEEDLVSAGRAGARPSACRRR